ncbi:hypothetical protein MHZ93_06105 [Roseomonas sp. ACRSG]|nr:hypothetical protein [Roseomonas sp. ACRSG]
MTAHRLPANCRCLWCPRTFDTPAEASTHMALMHRGNLVRSQDNEATAALIHYHQDREAVRKGGVVADESMDTPRGVGRSLAERLHGIPDRAFLPELDDILDHMREEMLAAGRQAPIALMICREIRQAARQEWVRLTGRQAVASGG